MRKFLLISLGLGASLSAMALAVNCIVPFDLAWIKETSVSRLQAQGGHLFVYYQQKRSGTPGVTATGNDRFFVVPWINVGFGSSDGGQHNWIGFWAGYLSLWSAPAWGEVSLYLNLSRLSLLLAAYPSYVVIIRRILPWLRRRRRLCVKCAYDLTGNTSGRCPECGMPSERGHLA
jgi:hypothetical protein